MGGNSTPAKLPCESCAVFLWTQNREAAIKLLRFGKQREIQPVVHTGIRERQHRYCYLSVNELSCDERAQGFTRSHSWTADTHMVAGTLTMCGEPLVKRRILRFQSRDQNWRNHFRRPCWKIYKAFIMADVTSSSHIDIVFDDYWLTLDDITKARYRYKALLYGFDPYKLKKSVFQKI